MPIAKMKRLQVLALERDHDALLRQLERMGCVEISEPDAPDAPESLRRCDSETADCLARQRQVQTAIDALRRAAPPKKAPLLAPRPAIGEAEYLSETGLADGLALARQVNEAAGRLQQLTALAAQLETDRITLGPWLSLDLPLELTETRCCDVTLGVLPPFVPWDELCGQVQNEYPESELHLLSADRQQQCVLLITHKAATAPVLELLRGRGFAASPLKGRTGTPEENRRRDADRLAEVKRQQEALRKQLDELAERLPELYLCADRLASRLQREENRRRLLTAGCIVAFDGWRPCAATYSSMSRFFSASMWRARVENSVTSSSGTPVIAHAGFRSRPISRASQERPKVRVMWSANTASCSSESATTAACIGLPSSERHFPSRTVLALLLMTTCVWR